MSIRKSDEDFDELSSRQRRRIVHNTVTQEYNEFLNEGTSSNNTSMQRESLMNLEEFETQILTLEENVFERYFFDDSDIEDLNEEDENIDYGADFDTGGIPIDTNLILRLRLCKWILRYHISDNAVEDLLAALIEFGIQLPKKKITLMKSENKQCYPPVQSRDVPDGKYLHFGIEKTLLSCNYEFFNSCETISIDINIDGLPLYKSSRKSVWPILGAFVNQKSISPFCIGIWSGTGHPKSSDLLLKDLSEEIIELKGRLIEVGRNRQKKKFHIRAFICDAPAKAFVKTVLNHNSKHGCNECNQIGFRLDNTPVYQIKSGELRSDESFLSRMDKPHHHQMNATKLEVAGIKMVTQFPLDPMHLLDLGIGKRILTYMLDIIPKNMHQVVSNSFISLGPYVPSEFARKPRGLTDLARWKAIEFRFFLLYSGIVVLKNQISDNMYYHFSLLSSAIRFMSDEINCDKYLDQIQILVNDFVELFPQLYGLKHVNYNLHSFLHLPNYAREYGSLDSFTGYKFEIFLQEIKKNVKCSNKILEQIRNRINERNFLNSQYYSLGLTESTNDDIFPGCTNYNSYTYNCQTFKLNNRDRFCFIETESGIVPFIIEKFEIIEGAQVIVGNRYIKEQPFFEEPVDSQIAHNILLVSEISKISEKFYVSEISGKYCRFPFENNFVLIPILHEPSKIKFC